MRLLTPPGVAGIAVVCAQPAERPALEPALRAQDGKPVVLTAGGPPRRAWLHLDGAKIDEVLAVDRGADGLELHLHGAPVVLEALHRVFGLEADAAATPAARLLREALAPAQLELALEQIACDFEAGCAAIERLPRARGLVAVREALERSRIALALATPARVVLAGGQNAGKSTLFNRLLFRERVLTGPTPGLTRDPVAECTTLDGYPYELVDTAGEGAAGSAVDAAAIEMGRRQRASSLLMLVVDAAIGPSPGDRALAGEAALVVANKSDLPPSDWPFAVPCHLRLSCVAWDAARIRLEVGQNLRRHRKLPAAGRVGGFAALAAGQLAHLQQLAVALDA
ncbi:MAG TPA: GTPase [Planctomycetota bacterium]